MNKKVAFFVRHFTERGTELSTFNYALYNEEILGNESIIIAFNKITAEKNNEFVNTSRSMFAKKFRIIEIDNIIKMRDLIFREKITNAYIQSHGCHRDFYQLNSKYIWQDCKTTYHYVFGPMIRQGSDVRCVIGNHLNIRFNKKIDVLPYIVEKFDFCGDIREVLNIPREALVFGRYGGFSTFDIGFVHEAIKEILKLESNIYFIFMNTEEFFSHKNIIYLPKTLDKKYKSKFISSCDAMIHARYDGETFGLAIAEFSSANKPVITFANSLDKEHLLILDKKAITYSNKDELIKIFKFFNKYYQKKINYNCFKKYEPQNVMQIFESLCLKPKSKNFYNLFKEFLYDLPWEIYILIELTSKNLFFSIIKILPLKIKLIIKSITKIL